MIEKVSEETRKRIRLKSAFSLPDDPSEAGLKPSEIKAALFRFVTDETDSVLAEIDRVVEQTNRAVEEDNEESFITDNTLTLKNGVLKVNTASVAEKDNTLPITSAAVEVIVGNIGALLRTI